MKSFDTIINSKRLHIEHTTNFRVDETYPQAPNQARITFCRMGMHEVKLLESDNIYTDEEAIEIAQAVALIEPAELRLVNFCYISLGGH